MSLAAAVQTRYSAQLLIELTNPGSDNSDETSLNTARLNAAASDATNDMQTILGVTYDDSATHQGYAAEGVIYYLALRAGKVELAASLRTEWYAHLEIAKQALGRERPSPQSNSVLAVSTETDSRGGTVRPDFDRSRFSRVIPLPPATS